jgi:hypothetical protein
MKLHFTADDRHAIDLALQPPGEQRGFVKSAGPSLRKRVCCIERVLGLLAYLPVAQPRPGLVQRTLKLVAQSGNGRSMRSRNQAPQAYVGFLSQGLCAPAISSQPLRRTQAKYPPS